MSVLTSAAAALASARAVVAAVSAETYLTAAAYEADANTARGLIAASIVAVDGAYGASGFALILALEGVAARLLDLREAIADDAAVVTEDYDRVSDLLSIAVENYSDFTRWTELVVLNPNLPHPGFIPAGRQVVRYVA